MSDSNFGKIKKPRKQRRRRALSSTHVPVLETRATQTENHFLQKRINSRLQNLVEFKILKMANNLLPTTKSLTRGDWSSQQQHQQMQHQLHQNMQSHQTQQLYPQQAEQPLQLRQQIPDQLIQIHPELPEQLFPLQQSHSEHLVQLQEQHQPVKNLQLQLEGPEQIQQLAAQEDESRSLDQLKLEELLQQPPKEEVGLDQEVQPSEHSQAQRSPQTQRSSQSQQPSQSPANNNNESRRRCPDRTRTQSHLLRIQAKTKQTKS